MPRPTSRSGPRRARRPRRSSAPPDDSCDSAPAGDGGSAVSPSLASCGAEQVCLTNDNGWTPALHLLFAASPGTLEAFATSSCTQRLRAYDVNGMCTLGSAPRAMSYRYTPGSGCKVTLLPQVQGSVTVESPRTLCCAFPF